MTPAELIQAILLTAASTVPYWAPFAALLIAGGLVLLVYWTAEE